MPSITYRILKKIGFNYSETEYGNVSLWEVIKKVFFTFRNAILLQWFMDAALLSPILPRYLRPKILKCIGCNVGKDVFIGSQVMIDSGHANMITLEDHVHITNRCLLLCHQRDISQYYIGDDAAKLSYKIASIRVCKGAMIGMNSMIMPGVTIGEGAIVGAFSLVTKDIPAWTIATGRPAKVVKQIGAREIL